MRAVIHLPSGTVVATANERDPVVAIDRMADALVNEIKRHTEQLRKDYVFKRKGRQRADVSAAGPLLERDSEFGRQKDFFQLLRPQLDFLRDHARRELRILELDGTLGRGEVTVADVLDEVITLAWQRFAERPRNLRLDLWLTDLLHEFLEQLVKQGVRPHVSLDETIGEVMPSESPQVGDQEWWAALLGYQDSLTLTDLIPDWKGTSSWDKLEAEELKDRLLAAVGQFPAAQRQAFLLHALEGFAFDEIAMMQDRPESEVRADIEAARQILRERIAGEPDANASATPAGAVTNKQT